MTKRQRERDEYRAHAAGKHAERMQHEALHRGARASDGGLHSPMTLRWLAEATAPMPPMAPKVRRKLRRL